MNRKIISFILSAAFVFCTFTGCAPMEEHEPVQTTVPLTQSEPEKTESTTEAQKTTSEAVSVPPKSAVKTKPSTASATTEKDSGNIYSEFKKCLENAKINGELPEYSVFDINADGTAELLVFDERIAVAIERGITVYSFDKKSGKSKKIGRAETFEGHSNICEASDGNGFIIQQDYPGFIKVTRYTFDGQELHEKKLIDKTYNGEIINALSDDEKGNEYLGNEIISSFDMGEGDESRLFEKAFG